MTDIVVSAHAGRWQDQKEDLTVPDGSQVVFYVNDGEELSIPRGYAILDALAARREPAAVRVLRAGDRTYDYSCWFAADFAKACGIYAFGSRTLLLDLTPYTEDRPLTLSEILRRFPRCRVFWDACRCVEAR